MDDKSVFDDDTAGSLFPETETRRVAERFAPRPRPVAVEAVRAIEQALREPPVRTVDDTLVERNKCHGEFNDDAAISQAIKFQMRQSKNWDDLTFVQKEALEHIAVKIGRILSGDPNHLDHWEDIQGYARLVETRL